MDERTNKLLEQFKTQGPLTTGQIGDVISSSSLQAEQPIQLTEPKVSTQAVGMTGRSDAIIELDKQEKEAEQKKIEEQNKLNENVAKQQSLLERIGLVKQQETTKGQDEFGLDVLKQSRGEAVKKLTENKVRKQAELQALQSANMTDAGKSAAIQEIDRKYALSDTQHQLNYYLANQDITAAEEVISDRITLATEPLYAQLDITEKVFDQIKGSLSKAEENEWVAATNRIGQQIKETEDLEKFKGSVALTYNQNNGKPLPSYIQAKINRAGSQGEINQILSDEGISLAKPVQPKGTGSNTPGINYTTNPDGSVTYESDLDAIIGATLSTIPTKFGQETFKSQMAKARDDSDRINLVASQVLKGQPAEFKNDFRNQAVGISMIDKAIAEIDNGTKTGALNASAQYAANFLGKDFDPALARIEGYITSAIQPYRNSVTGAAWGEQEDSEYASLFGSTKYSPAELKQRLLQTKELLKSKSAEGLNSFVNPLGYYENEFQKGALAPDTVEEPQTEVTKGFWSKASSWLFGDE